MVLRSNRFKPFAFQYAAFNHKFATFLFCLFNSSLIAHIYSLLYQSRGPRDIQALIKRVAYF